MRHASQFTKWHICQSMAMKELTVTIWFEDTELKAKAECWYGCKRVTEGGQVREDTARELWKAQNLCKEQSFSSGELIREGKGPESRRFGRQFWCGPSQAGRLELRWSPRLRVRSSSPVAFMTLSPGRLVRWQVDVYHVLSASPFVCFRREGFTIQSSGLFDKLAGLSLIWVWYTMYSCASGLILQVHRWSFSISMINVSVVSYDYAVQLVVIPLTCSVCPTSGSYLFTHTSDQLIQP